MYRKYGKKDMTQTNPKTTKKLPIKDGCPNGTQRLCNSCIPTEHVNKYILLEGIKAEIEAINLYADLIHATSDKRLKNTLREILNEEEVHIGEFSGLLEKIDPGYKKALSEGKKEVR